MRTSRAALKLEKLRLSFTTTNEFKCMKHASELTTQELRQVLRLVAYDAKQTSQIESDGLADILYEAAERLKGDRDHG